MTKQHIEEFKRLFQSTPTIWIDAPGRINLIGEHTDYNNGFVLPAAVDKKICFAFAKNDTNTARLYALDKSEFLNYSLDEAEIIPSGWQKYVTGMCKTFLQQGQGFDCVFGGNLPHGAGMSSSSALCCGLAYGLNILFEMGYEKREMTPLIQKAEAVCSGVNGGIMDQFSIMLGKKNKAILLDCQSLDYKYLPLELKNYCLLLCNTGVEHQLASTEYNTRRSECETGVAILQKNGVEATSLRDVDLDLLEKYKADFDPITFRRCKYVINENQRVHLATQALEQGDIARLGQLLYQSHEGLQNDYQVSCPELDFLVAFAKTQSYIAGARMMGGGFGGCTLNLLPKEKTEEFIQLISPVYKQEFGIKLETYLAVSGDGCRQPDKL